MPVIQAPNNQLVSPIDALWTLFIGQPKSVRKAFTERLISEDVHAETLRQQMIVKESLTQAFHELDDAKRTGRKLPNARNLFRN